MNPNFLQHAASGGAQYDRLGLMELAERTDNSDKFLSDMFHARLYRLAASRVGVPDYRRLVEQKLKTSRFSSALKAKLLSGHAS